VLSATTFSIPAFTGGTYTSGGVIGDGGLTIPSSAVNGRWLLSLKGPLNVRQFGAKGDGSIDDTAAFQWAIESVGNPSPAFFGTIIHVPQGTYVFTDNLHVDRMCILSGLSTMAQQFANLSFPAGKGIIIEGPGAPYPGGRADYAILENLCISGVILPEFVTAVNPWRTPGNWQRGDTAMVGGTDNSFYAECSTAGSAGSSNPFGNGPYTVGETFNDGMQPGHAVWTIQRTSVWTKNRNYTVGTRVQVPGENRICFQCTTAGESSAGPNNPFTLAGQDSTYGLGQAISEGPSHPQLTWTVVAYPGVKFNVRATIRNCLIQNFTNCGVMIQDAVPLNANGWRLDAVHISQCGVGVFVGGSDSNAGLATGLDVESSGYHQAGSGGLGIYDHSFQSATWVGCQVAGSSGANYNVANSASQTVFIGCYSEGNPAHPDRFLGPALVVGGQNGAFSSDSTATRVGFGGGGGNPDTGCRYIAITDGKGAIPVNVSLSLHDGQAVLAFGIGKSGNEDAEDGKTQGSGDYGNTIAYRYESTGYLTKGWWAQSYGLQNEVRPWLLSSSVAAEGPGHWWDYKGHFRSGDATYSNRYYLGFDPMSPFLKVIRGGHFTPGDRFETQYPGSPRNYLGMVVMTDGYLGNPWIPDWKDVATRTRSRPVGIFSDMAQPTRPNGYAYRCTKAGTTSSTTEPSWPTTVGPEVYTWSPRTIIRVNDYMRPTAPNGHYYQATAVTVNGGFSDATTGTVEPTPWPTTSGALKVETSVTGSITWTERGADPRNSYVTDGSGGTAAIWTCIGPTPTYAAYQEVVDPTKLAKSVTSGTYTLSASEYGHRFIELSGTLTGNVTIQFPNSSTLQFNGKAICTDWVVRNTATLGEFTVTLQTVGQVGGVVLGNNTQPVWNDGTNLRPLAPPV
jgi:hypothetical protein